jgi:hypothetical protein
MSDQSPAVARPTSGGLRDLQERFRELGRLRMGKLEKPAQGKARPVKLDTWRLTSPGRGRWLLEQAAKLYGGEVREWAEHPDDGEHYELITETDSLPIVIPPGQVLSQFYEQWSGGGCRKRCDGERQLLRDVACSCPMAIDERMAMAQRGQACTPVTRLSVILPELKDLGVWRLESHGYNAAVELAGVVQLIQVATTRGMLIPARLRIDKRTVKRLKDDGRGGTRSERRNFTVPVIETGVDFGEFAQAYGLPGLSDAAELAIPPAERKALPGAAPGMSTDEGAPEEEHLGDADGGAFAGRPPPTEPEPLSRGGVAGWVAALPGDEPAILAAAVAVAAELGVPIAPRSLEELSAMSIGEESRERIRRKLVEAADEKVAREEPTQETLT